MSLPGSTAPDHLGAAGQDDQAREIHPPRPPHGQGAAQAVIPTGILGRKPTEHRAGALLWLEGNNLRLGIVWAVNNPLEWLIGSILSFCFLGKIPRFHMDSEWKWMGSGSLLAFQYVGGRFPH